MAREQRRLAAIACAARVAAAPAYRGSGGAIDLGDIAARRIMGTVEQHQLPWFERCPAVNPNALPMNWEELDCAGCGLRATCTLLMFEDNAYVREYGCLIWDQRMTVEAVRRVHGPVASKPKSF